MTNDNSWTFTTLKEYFDTRLVHICQKIEQHFDLLDRAVCKSEQAMEKRLEGMNEFRQSLEDQNRTFMPRKELESIIGDIQDKLNRLEKHQERIANMKQGGNIVWAYVLSGVSLLAALIALVTNIGGG